MQDLVDEETQSVFEWAGAKKSEASKVPVDGVLTSNDDSTSVLSLELSLPPRAEQVTPHTLLITVVDRSGSMRSYWGGQVVPALNSMAQIVWNAEDKMTGHIITYATTVSGIDLGSRAAFQRELAATNASGGTHFSKAFKSIEEKLTAVVPALRKQHGDNMQVVIVFMTDGEDSEGTNMAGRKHWDVALASLKQFLRTSPHLEGLTSVFHALAFGANHDFPFLDDLRANAGTAPGGFQYAEPSDGAAALLTKLDAIVKSISNPAVLSQLRLEIPGFLVNVGGALKPVWHDGSAQPFKNPVLFRPGQNKVIYNLIIQSAGAQHEASTSSSETATDATASTASTTTSHNEWVTPVNTSAGITYATDYYGQVMPSFPQPGMSFAASTSLYSYDPYAMAASQFGPQPGMSHTFDFGPQPGSYHSTETPAETVSGTVVAEPISAATSVAPSSATSAAAPAPTSEPEAEIGAEYLTVKVHQVRQDALQAGEHSTELKVRVDRLHTSVDRLILEVQKMQVSMEALELEIMQAVLQQSNRDSWKAYGEVIHKYERQLNQSSSFLVSLGRTKRQQLSEMTTNIRETFTRLHSMLAEASKGAMTTSQLARMAEVAHGAQFSKARHARTMDARTSKNAAEIEKELELVRTHNVDVDAVAAVVYDEHAMDEAEKLLHEWFCVLTQDNWMNLLTQEKDVIGFGIALRRPEFVLDDPTQLRILDISLTCVAKSAFEHVLSHKLIQASKSSEDPIQAKLAYLGGFNVEGKDLGVVVRGSANEPINAWLPLYINAEHWKLAFLQFKSSTGYLVTVNPLGYAYNQVDVYFMILAVMIVRMKIASTRQLELTIQYLRTCAAIMNDLSGFRNRMKTFVSDFAKHRAKRLKDVTSNLLVVLGFLVVLPLEDLHEILPKDSDWTRLWLALFTEITRRALDSCSRSAQLGNAADKLMTNLVSRLVDGYMEEEELSTDALRQVFSPEESTEGAPPPPVPRTERAFKFFAHGPSATDAELDEKKRLLNAPASLALKPVTKDNKVSLWNRFWDAAESTVVEGPHSMEWASLHSTDDDRVMPKKTTNTAASSSNTSDIQAGQSLVTSAVVSATYHIPVDNMNSIVGYYGGMYQPEDKKAAAKEKREGRVDVQEIKNREFKPSAVLPKSLEAIRLCENVVANYGQPTIEGLINIMTFLKSWSNLQMLYGGTQAAFAELDRNLGVAPVSWIVHFRDDWDRRPHMRNSFFTFLNFVDVTQIPEFGQSSSLMPEILQLQMLRALLAQNATFATNKDARIAMEISSGPDYNRWRDPITESEAILTSYHKKRVERLISVASAVAAASASNDAVKRMGSTENIYEFIGTLVTSIGTSRSTVAFQSLFVSFISGPAPLRPLAIIKMAILLSGKYIDPESGVCVSIIPGREYIPGRKALSAFHRVWGFSGYKAVMNMVNLTYARASKAPATIDATEE
jgi:hypothetical protein